jgi:hypothetical protein
MGLRQQADPFMLHLYAALAEKERAMIPAAPGTRWRPKRLRVWR